MACCATDGEAEAPPDWLRGAWRRAGRRLGEGRLEEPAEVWWLQAARAFADLRLPIDGAEIAPGGIDGPRAFSGELALAGAGVAWHHDLDTAPPSGREDAAAVRLHGDVLVETGEGYEERWRRMSRRGEAVLAAERHEDGSCRARVVAVGDRAVGLWQRPSPGGGRFERRAGRWQLAALVGDREGLDETHAALASLAGLAGLAGLGGGARPPGDWRRV